MATGLAERALDDLAWEQVLPFLGPLADCLDCGVLLVERGRILHCSEPMAAMFGMTGAEAMALGPERFVERVAGLVDHPPSLLRQCLIVAGDGVPVCEDLQIARPSRRVLRWTARRLSAPRPLDLVVCTDVTAEAELSDAYDRIAIDDRLTGLLNQRGAEQIVHREIVRARRFAAPLSVVLFDVDRFRALIETLGSASADQVLRTVARAIAGQLRETDVSARWRSDEFLVALPNTGLESAALCGERIRKTIAAVHLPVATRVTVSGGVATFRPGDDFAALVARAEAQLARAKAEGRDRIV